MGKQWLIGFSLLFLGVMVGYWVATWRQSDTQLLRPVGESVREKPYERYGFQKIAERGGIASKIEERGDKFYYYSEGRRISGQVKHPEGKTRGIVVMARGYVDKENYVTGTGTKNAASYYAKHGYMTYAPDFSGYGESDPEDPNPLGARLVKPVEILDLIASLPTTDPIYLWGHSNGGQVMLSVAEILGKRGESQVRGLILWAPVSKPFPYNIMFYTDEASDAGKWLRNEVAKFEAEYDVFDYSIDRYLDWIKLPVQLHQGTEDQEVPVWWSRELKTRLKEIEIEVGYNEYVGADHNMRPSWENVVARNVSFMDSLN